MCSVARFVLSSAFDRVGTQSARNAKMRLLSAGTRVLLAADRLSTLLSNSSLQERRSLMRKASQNLLATAGASIEQLCAFRVLVMSHLRCIDQALKDKHCLNNLPASSANRLSRESNRDLHVHSRSEDASNVADRMAVNKVWACAASNNKMIRKTGSFAVT